MTIVPMVSRYTSDVFYHFVGLRNPTDHKTNYSTLLKILDAKAVTHLPHNVNSPYKMVTYRWDVDVQKGELIIPEVTCFCDIPYEALRVHLKKYGSFGISFLRNFVIKKGARPVIYLPLQSKDPMAGWGTLHGLTMLRDWMTIRQGFVEQLVAPLDKKTRVRSLGVKPTTPENAIFAMDDFITSEIFAFIKVFDSDLAEDGPENFYMEREWRMYGNLKFEPANVANVIAHDRPEYASKIIPAP